jgi:hypothetical protein
VSLKKPLSLSRRHLLKGLGGLGISLPLLEAMVPSKAYAQTALPKRYIVFFDGQSLGADDDPLHNAFVPDTVGRNYELKTGLAPLGALKDDVSVVSGLSIPTANGGTVPSGGRRDDFHVSSLSPLLSGVRSPTNTASAGVTSDQIVSGFIGGPPNSSLVYRVQADWYLSVSAPYGRDMISYKRDTTGSIVAIPPQVSPRQAFNSLFGNFVPPGVDPAVAKKAEFDLRARRSVLDLVHKDADRLKPQLSRQDQIRLERHLDEIRALEARIAAVPPPQTSVCVKPADPGTDPAAGPPQGTDANGDNTYSTSNGYSGEEQRARAFCDLVHMALACDLSRSVSLQMTMFQSHLNMYPLTGQATDLHELGHGGVPGGTRAMAVGHAWHVKHFAYLLQKLKDTPEGNGNMLDNTVMVFLLEGGHGNDPGGSRALSSHSTENMAMLVAGRAGGLKPGQHIVAAGKHPAHVLVSAMKSVGFTGNTLGEVTGDVPELFV